MSDVAKNIRSNLTAMAHALAKPETSTNPEFIRLPATRAELGQAIVGLLETHLTIVDLVVFISENPGQSPRSVVKELGDTTQAMLDLLAGLVGGEAGQDAE